MGSSGHRRIYVYPVAAASQSRQLCMDDESGHGDSFARTQHYYMYTTLIVAVNQFRCLKCT